jgi:hypothetical protein
MCDVSSTYFRQNRNYCPLKGRKWFSETAAMAKCRNRFTETLLWKALYTLGLFVCDKCGAEIEPLPVHHMVFSVYSFRFMKEGFLPRHRRFQGFINKTRFFLELQPWRKGLRVSWRVVSNFKTLVKRARGPNEWGPLFDLRVT